MTKVFAFLAVLAFLAFTVSVFRKAGSIDLLVVPFLMIGVVGIAYWQCGRADKQNNFVEYGSFEVDE